MRFTVYDPATGKIARFGVCGEDDFSSQASDGEAVVAGGYDDDFWWFDAGVASERPAVAIADVAIAVGESIVLATDIPAGTALSIDGVAAGPVDDGSLEFSALEAGVYRIAVTPPFPWRPSACTVTVS